jgi:hypothetical protein
MQAEDAGHRCFGVGEKRLAYAAPDRSRSHEYLVENGFTRFDREKTRNIAPVGGNRHDPTPGELQIDARPQLNKGRYHGRTDSRQACAAMPDFGDRVTVGFKRRSQLIGTGFKVHVGQAALQIALPQ